MNFGDLGKLFYKRFCILDLAAVLSLLGHSYTCFGLPGGTSGKEPACQCRKRTRHSSIPGLERSLGGGYGNPLQYSCLENPMNKGAWAAVVHWVTKSRT